MRVQQDEVRDIEAKSIALRPGLAFFPLDDELIVFSEATQALIGLNATAAFLLHLLADGVPARELAGALVAEGRAAAADAQHWVESTLEAFGSQGLLAGRDGSIPCPGTLSGEEENVPPDRARMPPLESFEPKAVGHYRLLGTRALIRYGHNAQKRMVETVIGHLAAQDTAAPTLVIDITAEILENGHLRSNIYCNGVPERQATMLSAVGPLVKGVLWATAVNAFDFILDLHAGVVGEEGRCILLPAAAGSGKSSLTAALTHSGLGYYSDEVALVERETFCVPAVPLAVCVKSTGWDLMSRYYPELPALPIHRRNDGKRVRYVPPRAALQKAPARVSHIFFPLYSANHPTSLVRVTRADALARLMDQCLALRLRLDHDSVKRLVEWIEKIDCYALTFSSLDEAVSLVRRTAFAK